MRLKKVIYFVSHGPDRNHLWDSKPFDFLRDAREFARNLPDTPTGEKRPFKIERYRYKECSIYGDLVDISEVRA